MSWEGGGGEGFSLGSVDGYVEGLGDLYMDIFSSPALAFGFVIRYRAAVDICGVRRLRVDR